MTVSATTGLAVVHRATAAKLAVGSVCACAVVALVDPGSPGRYPPCPTSALLGFDCPACGTLRGIHALSRGRLATALDHNLLLALAVPLGLVAWWGWVRVAAGRAPWPVTWPRWALPAVMVVAVAFTLARNLPVDGLAWLASDAAS